MKQLLNFDKQEMQQYLYENTNTNISKFISKAKAKILEIKTHTSWKFEDKLCSGCKIKEESGEEIFLCEKFGLDAKNEKIPTYSLFYGKKNSEMFYCAKVMMERMKITQILY